MKREKIEELPICQDYKGCIGKKEVDGKVICERPQWSCIWRKGAV